MKNLSNLMIKKPIIITAKFKLIYVNFSENFYDNLFNVFYDIICLVVL